MLSKPRFSLLFGLLSAPLRDLFLQKKLTFSALFQRLLGTLRNTRPCVSLRRRGESARPGDPSCTEFHKKLISFPYSSFCALFMNSGSFVSFLAALLVLTFRPHFTKKHDLLDFSWFLTFLCFTAQVQHICISGPPFLLVFRFSSLLRPFGVDIVFASSRFAVTLVFHVF